MKKIKSVAIVIAFSFLLVITSGSNVANAKSNERPYLEYSTIDLRKIGCFENEYIGGFEDGKYQIESEANELYIKIYNMSKFDQITSISCPKRNWYINGSNGGIYIFFYHDPYDWHQKGRPTFKKNTKTTAKIKITKVDGSKHTLKLTVIGN